MSSEADRKIAGHPAARALFELLEAVFGRGSYHPTAQWTAKPVLLGRDFAGSRWFEPNVDPSEIYRFQLGPRTWSKHIYVYEGHKVDDRHPLYEQELERFAKQLKLAEWEKLAQPLIDMRLGRRAPENGQSTVQVTLSWQDDGRFCVVHDRPARTALAFEWGEARLSLLGEAHPERLGKYDIRNAFDAHRRPVVPRDEGEAVPKAAERAGRMDEFLAELMWRYSTRLDRRLDALLLEACDRLRGLNGDAGLAFARHRFNDACGDDGWLAVRLGNFAWENGAYFRSGANSLRSAPSQIHELLGMLVHLQAGGIGEAFNESYGYPVEPLDVIGLFRQADSYYFACANSQGASGPVYEISLATGQTSLIGFTDRFDWNFNHGSRAGGVIPKGDALDIVTLDELVRRIEAGDTPYDAGPPHDLAVDWMSYLPRDPYQSAD